MKMKHMDTGEIVFVIGYVAPNKNCQKTHAICLCDARLHPGENGRKPIENGTIEIEVPAKKLMPLDIPNWNDVQHFYLDGEYEALLESREELWAKRVESAADSVAKQEMSNLRKNGVTDENLIAELAAKKREAYIAQRTLREHSIERPLHW